MTNLDDVREEAGKSVSKGFDLLDDPLSVASIENFTNATTEFILYLSIHTDLTPGEIASFSGGTFMRILYEINKD